MAAPHLTASQLAALLGDWRSGPGSLHTRLSLRLSQLLSDGRVASGVRLPAERPLAVELRVSRTTIIRSFDELRRLGLLESRRGAGSVTRVGTPSAQAFVPWVSAQSGPAHDHETFDLTKASPRADPALADVLRRAAARAPELLAHHGYYSLGVQDLRKRVAERYEHRGLPTSPEQILITAGAQQAIDLVVRAFVRRREAAIVESPTYAGALDSLRLAGAKLLAFDVSHGGWELDRLDALVQQTGAQLAYLMPDFQNPTGAFMEDSERERLADLCARQGVMMLVDETLAELALDDRRRPLPLAAYESGGSIISVGSLSKAIWAGLRVGWVRADPATITALARLRATASLGGAPVEQLAGAQVLPDLEAYLGRLRPEVVDQRDALLRAIDELGWTAEKPRGGLSCWARLPSPASSRLAQLALQRGVILMPGHRLSPDGVLDGYVRLPYTLPAASLLAAMKILGECWQKIELA